MPDFMAEAFKEAEKAFLENEVPIGSVVVLDGRIIGRGRNQVEALKDPTAHAELLAITAAANESNDQRLSEAVLYTTLEPCPMCMGAILLSRIKEVVFAARDPRFGAAGSYVSLHNKSPFGPPPGITSGIMEKESGELLKRFFGRLRQKEH